MGKEIILLTETQRIALIRFCQALVNQQRAQVIVAPKRPASGHWFGGGNMVAGPDGALYLTGRFRNQGDSRTGLGLGERGLALDILTSRDGGFTWNTILSFSKRDLDVAGHAVESIEGSALRFAADGSVELFVSSEKGDIRYPEGWEAYQKPGTGVWTIERLRAPTIYELRQAQVEPLLECRDLRYVHVKDPVVYERTNGDTVLVFCTHPYCWTSSNSAYAVRRAGAAAFGPPVFEFFPRGATWDVAMSRITGLLRVPQIGPFTDGEPLVLMFYDGGESVRNLDEHAKAVRRPRGYSCEELGGVAVALERDLRVHERLSLYLPMFVSPWGTGASRYVDVLPTEDGYLATWEQSQPNGSQPLVMHQLSRQDAESLLR